MHLAGIPGEDKAGRMDTVWQSRCFATNEPGGKRWAYPGKMQK